MPLHPRPEAEWGTPLICAIDTQETSEIAEFLLAAGANVNLKNEFTSPLGAAIRKGNFRLVKCLVESGTEVKNTIYNLTFDDEEGKENQKIFDYLFPRITDLKEREWVRRESFCSPIEVLNSQESEPSSEPPF